MNINKINKDIEVLCDLMTMVSDHLSQLISFSEEYIHECDDISELVDSIVKCCVDNEKIIMSLMLDKLSNIIEENHYE